jgi:hypothetical protein
MSLPAEFRWWHTPVITALWRLMLEDHEFKASLDYLVRPCLKKKKCESQIVGDQSARFNVTKKGDNNVT